MDVLQKSLSKVLGTLPEIVLTRQIAKKLKHQGIKAPQTICSKIAKHILSGKSTPLDFKLKSSSNKNVNLAFSPEDADEIIQIVSNFLEKDLPNLLPNLADRVSKGILKHLKSRWSEEHAFQKADLTEFRERIEQRWSKPLNQMRMLLTMAREWGETIHARSRASKYKNKVQKQILLRLHVRACQVTDEIICLLENGFADGAMARWRTLHELAVVAAVILRHGEDIAERYLTHQAIESKRAMSKYIKCCGLLGYKPLSVRDMRKINRAYALAIAKYGKEFDADFGWATFHLKRKRVTFVDLEAEAGRADMRSYYQMGNDNVHAGVKSLFVRLGLLNYQALLAGRSNAGLMEPGQNTAHTLTQISALVCLGEPIFDDLVIMQLMCQLRDEIPKSFHQADKKLRWNDKKYNLSI